MSVPHVIITTDALRLRNLSDDSRLSGLDVWLLPEGGNPATDLIQLTPDIGITWQYNYPAQVTNGTYDLYIGPSGSQQAATINGQQVKVRVMRNGIVKAEDTDFAKAW